MFGNNICCIKLQLVSWQVLVGSWRCRQRVEQMHIY